MAYLPGWTFQSPDYLNSPLLSFLVAHICVCVNLALKFFMGENVFFLAWLKTTRTTPKMELKRQLEKSMKRRKKQYAGCFWKLLKNLWWQDFCEWFIFLLDAFYPLWRFLAKNPGSKSFSNLECVSHARFSYLLLQQTTSSYT